MPLKYIWSGIPAAAAILCCCGLLSSFGIQGQEGSRRNESHARVTPFDTDIVIDALSSIAWLDNERLVITTPAKGANSDPSAPATQVILLNLSTHKRDLIANDGRVWSVDTSDSSFVVGPWSPDAEGKFSGGRRFSLTAAGKAVETGKVEPLAAKSRPPPDTPCAEGRIQCKQLERKEDGYLFVDEKTYHEKARVGLGTEIPLMWAQPGKPPITLPLLLSDIGGGVTYVQFLGKYLLDPGQRGPFVLLAPDGSIEQIPYPSLAIDPQTELFGQLLVTRAGVVITKDDRGLRGGTLHGSMGLVLPSGEFAPLLDHSNYLTGGMFVLSLSPDGCTIAYSQVTASRLALALSVRGPPQRFLSFVNVCRQLR